MITILLLIVFKIIVTSSKNYIHLYMVYLLIKVQGMLRELSKKYEQKLIDILLLICYIIYR